MPIYAALAYDAVNVLARAFHQVVNVDHESKYDGKLIVRAMEEMEYDSKFYVTIIPLNRLMPYSHEMVLLILCSN